MYFCLTIDERMVCHLVHCLRRRGSDSTRRKEGAQDTAEGNECSQFRNLFRVSLATSAVRHRAPNGFRARRDFFIPLLMGVRMDYHTLA